jgi:ABC-type transport system substrate-binding protein
VARANPHFFLGPPRIETVEIRFIADPNTVLANLLAGEIDLSSSTSITANEAVIARDQWAGRNEGWIKTWQTRLIFVDFQHREVPNWQRAVGDVRVRQGLMHALDRDSIADVINLGLAPKAEAYVIPGDPAFAEVDRAITKYPYDPARASTLFADAGWRRPSTGAALANAAGQALDLEVWADDEREAAIVADAWKTAGITSVPHRVPNARRADQEYRNHFPGTQIGSNTISQEELHTVASKLPRAELGWLGSNRGSFTDPEVERYHNLVLTSFGEQELRSAMVGMHQRLTQLVAFGPLFYQVEVIAAKQRVRGPVGSAGAQSGITWNIWAWEVDD